MAPSTLNPRGPAAREIAALWWIIFGLATVIFIIVIGLFLYAAFRSRRDIRPSAEPLEVIANPPSGIAFILVGGIAIPAVILVLLFLLTLRTMDLLRPPNVEERLVVEVVGHQWWWEVHYPDQGVTTANELRLPVGLPVEVRLMSADVIHSFWVPQLHGKMDANPGRVNFLPLQADESGVFYGECAEFCGMQHAKMSFVVVAEPPDQFETWLAEQQEPAQEVSGTDQAQGLRVFLESGCAECHTIRGTNATGDLGPDLTHLASRLTLGAGIIENNRGNLGGWIANPQAIKPGNKMPAVDLTGSQLQALLDYLETLE